jgi:hypothetical protein
VPDISVLVPLHDDLEYLPRALGSLLAQTGVSWELVVIDDGCTVDPAPVVGAALDGRPFVLRRHAANRGLGAACNTGLAAASGRLIAYLPADDVLFAGHLAGLAAALAADPGAAAAIADTDEPVAGTQAVQVLHRAGAVRWCERTEFESADLDATAWHGWPGRAVRTGAVTCHWTQRAGQRSRLLDPARDGGLNPFRRRYAARGPLRLLLTGGDPVDERELYGLPSTEPATEPDRHVLLVGELAYNADRILDLEARGVRLSGLWLDDPLGFMTVGPLPFGRVADVPRAGWREHVRRDRPDVVHCLLNWRTLPLALAVAEALPGVPLLWQFKEAPQRCLARGDWPLLVRLWERADDVLLCSDEERAWLLDALPGRRDPATVGVSDGDRPRERWFGPVRARADDLGPGVHTVCAGRPVGLDEELVRVLAAHDIHLHLHGLPPDARRDWLPGMTAAAPQHVHLHPAVAPAAWTDVLGRYDAGWLHARPPRNGGELRRATWDDLNVPARLPTLAAAGLPLVLPAAEGAVSAVGRIARGTGAGITYESADELVAWLHNRPALDRARAEMTAARTRFSFTSEADALVRRYDALAGRAGNRMVEVVR